MVPQLLAKALSLFMFRSKKYYHCLLLVVGFLFGLGLRIEGQTYVCVFLVALLKPKVHMYYSEGNVTGVTAPFVCMIDGQTLPPSWLVRAVCEWRCASNRLRYGEVGESPKQAQRSKPRPCLLSSLLTPWLVSIVT